MSTIQSGPDLNKSLIIRSQGLYWAVFDAAFEARLREFSQHVFDRSKQLAAEQHNYELMAFNTLHQQLEHDGVAFVFIPMVYGVYQLEFSIFIETRSIDFSAFTTDQYTRDSEKDITLNLPSGKLSVAELVSHFSIDQSVITVPAGRYRVCCLNNRDEQDKHAFLEDNYPPGDGPDFKFLLERQIN